MKHNNDLPPIDTPNWEIIVNMALDLNEETPKPLFAYNSSSGLYPIAALNLSKVNPADYNSDDEQLRLAFESVNNYLYAKIKNQEINPENISNPFDTELNNVPENKYPLLDMALQRTEPNKLVVAESILSSMDDYTQTANEFRGNFEAWKPVIQKEIKYLNNQIQIIDNSES